MATSDRDVQTLAGHAGGGADLGSGEPASDRAINSGDSLDLCHSKRMRFLPMVDYEELTQLSAAFHRRRAALPTNCLSATEACTGRRRCRLPPVYKEGELWLRFTEILTTSIAQPLIC